MFKRDINEHTGAPAVISNGVVLPTEIFEEIQQFTLEDIKNLPTNFGLPLYMSKFEDLNEPMDYGVLYQLHEDGKVSFTGYAPSIIESIRGQMEEFNVRIEDLLAFTTPHTIKEIKEFTL